MAEMSTASEAPHHSASSRGIRSPSSTSFQHGLMGTTSLSLGSGHDAMAAPTGADGAIASLYATAQRGRGGSREGASPARTGAKRRLAAALEAPRAALR